MAAGFRGRGYVTTKEAEDEMFFLEAHQQNRKI
jgi:hypothetical protein